MRLLAPLALVLAAAPAAAQRYPAYFDDFTYARVGTPQSTPAEDALLGATRWLFGDGRSVEMRSWRLGTDDTGFAEPAAAFFGGPAAVELRGAGAPRRLRLSMGAGFPNPPERGGRTPTLQTAQLFPPAGAFAARVRFGSLERAQNLIQAFWLYGLDQYKFCPPAAPGCDVRSSPDGTTSAVDEFDFEFNNWFLGQPDDNLHVGGIRYRHQNDRVDSGANGAPLDCTGGRPRCLDASGASLIAGRWYVLSVHFGPDVDGLVFEAVEDEPAGGALRPSARRATAPGDTSPYVVRYTRGHDVEGDGRWEQLPLPLRPVFPLAMVLSLHYFGHAVYGEEPACPPVAGVDVTCEPTTMEVDWVYHSPRPLSAAGVVREVAAWRSRGAGRVNTVERFPEVADPPITSAGADSARIRLVLDGPARTSGPAAWVVRPAHIRGIIYRMEVEIETHCAAGADRCRPRTIRPRDPRFELAPLLGETGMTVRAKLRDPWWGFTHAPSPGSAWREWEVRFERP